MTLNNSSLFDILTVVAFALSPFLYSRDNEAVQKLNGVKYSTSCCMVTTKKCLMLMFCMRITY